MKTTTEKVCWFLKNFIQNQVLTSLLACCLWSVLHGNIISEQIISSGLLLSQQTKTRNENRKCVLVFEKVSLKPRCTSLLACFLWSVLLGNIILKKREITKKNIVSVKRNCTFKHIHTYIIGHYNPSVRIIDLVSHTTYAVCINFLYISGGTYSLKSTANYKRKKINNRYFFYLFSIYFVAYF